MLGGVALALSDFEHGHLVRDFKLDLTRAGWKMVWQSTMEDLIASRAITGALGSWMRASVEADGLTLEQMQETVKVDFSGDMHADPRGWKHVWSAGQGVGGITKPETIADVVTTLVAQYNEAVDGQSHRSRFGKTHTNGA